MGGTKWLIIHQRAEREGPADKGVSGPVEELLSSLTVARVETCLVWSIPIADWITAKLTDAP